MRDKRSPMFLYFMMISIILLTCSSQEKRFTNSIDMNFVLIDQGSFQMGSLNGTANDYFNVAGYLTEGDWDEKPIHRVKISKSFYMAETEVTAEQFRKFRPDYTGCEKYYPYASGISWHDAQAFCEWLSEKEGKPYRLPTEAEWEYVCRAGSKTLFSAGDTLPNSEKPNSWGIKNMHTKVAEWCLDWHGMYPVEAQIDPIGPDQGIAKVVRGGGLDRQLPYYARSANRASIAPNFPPLPIEEMKEMVNKGMSRKNSQKSIVEKPKGFKSRYAYEKFVRQELNNQGNHNIGFRVVQAPMPAGEPFPSYVSFAQKGIKQNKLIAMQGPDPNEPYFRKRYLLPTPPENTPVDKLDAIRIVGFHPAILRHNHSPTLEVCPNGDVFAIYYTSVEEMAPDVAMIACRLRFGSDEWDMPSLFLDFADVDDHAPLLWNDKDTLHFFWGANKLSSGFPFQWISSTDHGASWGKVRFPIFETLVGPHSAQPINTAFRDSEGSIYIASDGDGPKSVLWISHNNGKTWIDTGGRSGGRHTTFVMLNDGRILGMGGKSSNIDGYMPKSISSDGGKTWVITKTPFSALGSNQRPTIIRLKSGRLFFAGDFQHRSGRQPKGFTQRGAYVALSEDEGETWLIKKLPGVQEHESPQRSKDLKGETLGYAVARQASNGVIHLITSMNEPCLHFAMNEAWILQSNDKKIDPTGLMSPTAKTIHNVEEFKEFYENGKMKAIWNAGIAENGRYLLHGTEIWYYKNGKKQWEATYNLGRKIGQEIYWSRQGNKVWSWNHEECGINVWTHWYPNGQKKSESSWRNGKCENESIFWNRSGKVMRKMTFEQGIPIN